MKALAQAFLVGMGVLGLFLAVPGAILAWLEHRSSGANLTSNQINLILSPLICCSAIAVGVLWQKRTKRSEPRRSPGRLTEDSAGGDGGGGDGGD
jgi:hypothetical protein